MLGWIEKVVPQPPVIIPPAPKIVEIVTKPEPKPKSKKAKSGHGQKKSSEGKSSRLEKVSEKEAVATPDPVPTESSGQPVRSWLSQGLEKVVPQPSPKASKPQEEAKSAEVSTQTESPNVENEERSGSGKNEADVIPDPVSTTEGPGQAVLSWLSQGLEKVVPQPSPKISVPQQDVKSPEVSIQVETEKTEKEEKPETTAAEPSGGEGEPQPSSDDPEKTDGKKLFKRLLEEFEKMIPKPEVVKKTEEATPKEPAAEPVKASSTTGEKSQSSADTQSVTSASQFSQTPDGNGGSVFKKFMQRLEKAIPQPVSKGKPEGQNAASGDAGPGQETNKGT